MSAASCSSLTYCSSSMNITTAVLAERAAKPTCSSSAAKSPSSSPLSARPGSGSKSIPTSISLYFNFSAFAKPANALRPRLAVLLADSTRLRRSRTWRSCGASSAGSERFSGASMRTEKTPFAVASFRIWSNSTVFPTPRRPTMITLFDGLEILRRAIEMRTCSRKLSLPASSGGGDPAPGEYGFVIGSIWQEYSEVREFMVQG